MTGNDSGDFTPQVGHACAVRSRRTGLLGSTTMRSLAATLTLAASAALAQEHLDRALEDQVARHQGAIDACFADAADRRAVHLKLRVVQGKPPTVLLPLEPMTPTTACLAHEVTTWPITSAQIPEIWLELAPSRPARSADAGLAAPFDANTYPQPGEKMDVTGHVKARIKSIDACYERQLKREPRLKGKIAVRFVITPAGGTKNVELVAQSAGMAATGACVVDLMKRWTFPFPPKEDEVISSYPFVFSPR